jgi:hypothetical protein
MRYVALREYAAIKGIILEAYVASTDTDEATIQVLEKYRHHGVHYVTTVNERIGAKWNTACSYAISTFPEYVCICGDDDLLLDSWIDAIIPHIGVGVFAGDMEPWVAFSTAYALNSDGRSAVLGYGRQKPLGSGCLIRTDVMRLCGQKVMVNWMRETEAFEQRDWLTLPQFEYLSGCGHVKEILREFRLWPPDLRRGLDLHRDYALASHGFQCVVDNTPCVVAIKTRRNIWKWEQMEGAGWLSKQDDTDSTALLSPSELTYWHANIHEQ